MKTILFILMLFPSVVFGQRFIVTQIIYKEVKETGVESSYSPPATQYGVFVNMTDSAAYLITPSDSIDMKLPKDYRNYHRKWNNTKNENGDMIIYFSIKDKNSILRVRQNKLEIFFIMDKLYEVR